MKNKGRELNFSIAGHAQRTARPADHPARVRLPRGIVPHHDQAGLWLRSARRAALAERFAGYATDASAPQLAEAIRHPQVTYAVASAESVPLADATVDLAVVAQALHWFDFPRYFAEVHRVLRPDGVFAAWGYGANQVNSAVDPIVSRYYRDIVGPYWPDERRHVEAGYATIPFPFADRATPEFAMVHQWDLRQLEHYLDTWSASRRYEQATGKLPLSVIRAELATAWGDPGQTKEIRWPLFLRVGLRREFPL